MKKREKGCLPQRLLVSIAVPFAVVCSTATAAAAALALALEKGINTIISEKS